MEFLPQLATIGLVLLLACISPGPDFLAVTSHALSSRRSGLRVAYGICAAITIWAALAIAGLAFILSRIDWLYQLIRLVGAAYLIYIGIQMLLSAAKKDESSARSMHRRAGGSFRRGFVIGITNPKSAAFFSSLFTAVLPPQAPQWVYWSTVGIAAAVAVAWFTALALMFSLGRIQRLYRKAQRGLDALMGGVLALIGLRLAV